MRDKTPSESFTQLTELVLPNDTNALGNLMGGRLLHWMDIAGAIAASRHSQRVCVTAAVDYVDFKCPIKLGEVVILEAKVTRAYRTSMEVKIQVYAQNLQSTAQRLCNVAYYTFVAIDQAGCPIPVPKVLPQTEEEKVEYEAAAQRRELRLSMAGKASPTPS